MTVSLMIEDEEVCRMAREIAALTGENTTTAVAKALRERLHRLRQEPGLADRLMAIGQDCARRMDQAHLALDHGALLYDERGLPR